MNDADRIEKFYMDTLDEFGESDARSVHWADVGNQLRRFDVLLGVKNVAGKSLLDVGCGLGDLYKHLLALGIQVKYTGIDIMKEFIEGARRKYPGERFMTQNVDDMQEKFDVVVASGALSFKLHDRDSKSYYFSLVKKMYDCANEAVSFNMLLKGHHIDDSDFATYDPSEVSDFCRTFCDRVEIVTDYLPNDFTIYLYK